MKDTLNKDTLDKRKTLLKESKEWAEKNKSSFVDGLNSAVRDEMKEFYKAEDLAKKLDVNVMTIYRYIKAGRLKAYKIGKEFRIDKSEFNSFLEETSTK